MDNKFGQALPRSQSFRWFVKVGKGESCPVGTASGLPNSTRHLSSTDEHIPYLEDVFVHQQPLVSIQDPTVHCASDNGTLVMPGECKDSVPLAGVVVRDCIVDNDCVVTDWRDWELVEPSPPTCRLQVNGQTVGWPTDTTIRTRGVIWQSFGNGARCPHLHKELLADQLHNHSIVHQLQVCQQLHEWHVRNWTDCIALSCGPGR